MSGPYSPVPTVQPEVGAAPYESLDISPDAFGAGVGRATERLGETIGHVADEQHRVALELQQQHNETVINDARAGLSDKYGEIEARYRQLHGNDAVTQLPAYQKEIEKANADAMKALPNIPQVRHAFELHARDYQSQTMRGFGLHAADQADQAHIESLQGLVDAAKSRLVRGSGLGNAAPDYHELVDSVAQLGIKLGWDKPKVAAYLQKQTGDAVADMVEARIAANSLGQAQNIFRAAVKATVPGTDVPFLDADSQARISHTLHVEIKQREVLARSEAAEDSQNLAQSDIQARILTGVGLAPEVQARIRAGMSARQWDDYKAKTKRADLVYKETGDIRLTPTAQIMGNLEKLKPTVDAATGFAPADFADRQAAYVQAAAIAQNEIKLRQTDPGQAVRNAFPTTVGAAWQSYEAKPSPEALQTAMKASETAQNALGIASVPGHREGLLPVAMVRQIAGSITAAPPQQAHQQLQSWAQQFGPYWPKAFRQMSKLLDPAMKVAAIMPDSSAASLLIETSRQEPAKLKKALDLPASGSGSLMNRIATDPDMQDLRASLSQRSGGGATAEAVATSVETLAMGLIQTRNVSVSEAVDTAIKRVIKDKYAIGRVNDRPFHVQADKPVVPIEQGAAATLRTIADGVLDLPPDVPKGMSKADADKQWADAVRTNGFWVTNDDASGLILYADRSSGGTPVRIKGKPITMTWDQLQAASIAHPATAPEAAYFGTPNLPPESAGTH